MRWVKHLTRARNDPRMVQLLDECGPLGYGAYWMIVEIVGEQLEPGAAPAVSYSLPQWSRMLYMHHHRVSNLLTAMDVIGLVKVEYVSGKIRVNVPNILKYRDEYSKKSGVARDEVSQDRIDIEQKNRSEQIRTETPSSPSGDGQVLTPEIQPDFPLWAGTSLGEKRSFTGTRCPSDTAPDPFEDWFEREFWPAYPRKVAKSDAKKAGRKALQTAEHRDQAMRRLKHDCAEWIGRPPEKRPHATTWFNQNRWKDPIEDDPMPLLAVGATASPVKADARNALMRRRILEEIHEQQSGETLQRA